MKLTPGELYFIRENEVRTGELTPYVKIGIVREKAGDERTSEDRALEHQTGNPRKLFVESIIKTPAVSEIENILHNLYADDRIYGEWFDFTNEQFESAKKVANELVKVAIENKENFAIAESLSARASRSEMIKPTKEIIGWHTKLLEAEIRVKECNALQDEIKRAFRAILAEPNQVGTLKEREKVLAPFLKVQEKKAKLEFDTEAFATARPDLYAEFTTIKLMPPKGSFTISRPKNFMTKLELVDHGLFLYSIIAKQTLSKFESKVATKEELHIVSLKLLGFEAKASWDKEIAQVNLKVFCQDYSGIEGLCKWNRKSKETSSFDKAAFIQAHPGIAEDFMTEIELSASLIVEKKRAYTSENGLPRVGNQ